MYFVPFYGHFATQIQYTILSIVSICIATYAIRPRRAASLSTHPYHRHSQRAMHKHLCPHPHYLCIYLFNTFHLTLVGTLRCCFSHKVLNYYCCPAHMLRRPGVILMSYDHTLHRTPLDATDKVCQLRCWRYSRNLVRDRFWARVFDQCQTGFVRSNGAVVSFALEGKRL